MQQERRGAERAQVSFDVMWDGDKGRNKGEVIDISTTGCFVLSGGVYKEKELIKLEMLLPISQQMISVWGMVANTFPEMGFGIKFTHVNDSDETLISEIVVSENRKAAEPQIMLPNGHTFIPAYA